MSKAVLAWHFLKASGRLRDGRPAPEEGVWLRHEGPLVMCHSGLHASRRVEDALRYAPGTTLCRVRCESDIIEGDDKLVCREREILWRMDATEALREFARMRALSVVHLWEPPEIVLRFLVNGSRADAYAAAYAAYAAPYAAYAAAADARYAAAYAAHAAAYAVNAAADAAAAHAAAAVQVGSQSPSLERLIQSSSPWTWVNGPRRLEIPERP